MNISYHITKKLNITKEIQTLIHISFHYPWNGRGPLLVNIILFGLSFKALRESFDTVIGVLFSFPTNVGHHSPPLLGPSVCTDTLLCDYPFRGTARRLTHRPVSGSDTNCNGPSPLLANIVLLSNFPSRL